MIFSPMSLLISFKIYTIYRVKIIFCSRSYYIKNANTLILKDLLLLFSLNNWWPSSEKLAETVPASYQGIKFNEENRCRLCFNGALGGYRWGQRGAPKAGPSSRVGRFHANANRNKINLRNYKMVMIHLFLSIPGV